MRRILLVCTGNTCRSPMAEALLRHKLASRGLEDIEPLSAGTGAWEGAPASEGAYLVSLEHGLDLSSHRARLVTREMVTEADLVLTMARHHLARVEELGAAGKAWLLGEFAGRTRDSAELRDPFGGELEGYRETFQELDTMLDAIVTRLQRERLGDRR